MDGTYIVPSPEGSRWAEMESVPVELARQTQGRLFEKQILSKGTLIHPKTGERISVDDAFVSQLMSNFEHNVCDIVQVPLANDRNEHVENPAANIGEVTALRERGGNVYAVIDARDEDAAKKLGKTYLGASAFLSTNYTDSRTGKKAGPTLLHVAVTNRPYVVGLEGYREIIQATAVSDIEDEITVLTQEETTVPRTLDEIKAELSAEHGIDLDALQASNAQPPAAPDQTQLTSAIADALRNTPVALSANGEGITGDDLVGAVVELSRQNAQLASGYDEIRRDRASERVDKLVADGYVFPKQREFAINLLLTKPQDFEAFVPETKVVPVNEQTGFTAPRDEREKTQQHEEIVRLTGEYKEYFDPSGAKRK